MHEKYSHEFATPKDLMRLASKWMEDCNARHHCVVSSQNYKLPTRLVRISDGDLQLVLTVQSPPKSKYATLSHFWRLRQPLKLLKSKVEDFRSKLPRDKLRKTFEDAIFTGSAVALEYLWIDSLCIMQDDEEDRGQRIFTDE